MSASALSSCGAERAAAKSESPEASAAEGRARGSARSSERTAVTACSLSSSHCDDDVSGNTPSAPAFCGNEPHRKKCSMTPRLYLLLVGCCLRKENCTFVCVAAHMSQAVVATESGAAKGPAKTGGAAAAAGRAAMGTAGRTAS